MASPKARPCVEVTLISPKDYILVEADRTDRTGMLHSLARCRMPTCVVAGTNPDNEQAGARWGE